MSKAKANGWTLIVCESRNKAAQFCPVPWRIISCSSGKACANLAGSSWPVPLAPVLSSSWFLRDSSSRFVWISAGPVRTANFSQHTSKPGSRSSGSGKPLHWTSCLKIAEDVAAGLLYLHQSSPPVVHGNLKSSNVLLGADFESCLTDFGLVPSLLPSTDDDHHLPSSSSLFYRAPETRHPLFRSFTPRSDVYSFGVLLLELLTGKTPFQDLVEEHGADIPRWVRSVREEERESGEDPVSSGNETSEDKLAALLNVAMACVAVEAERRPATKEVLKMIRDARAEVIVSSNSSDHSPGRWSDTVQSFPREYGAEHLNFGERD